MAVALETVVKQLEDSGIVAPGKLENFVPPKAHPSSVEELVRLLVKENHLTKFQAAQVANGRAKSLILGGYTILDKIGAGGMGQVFKALHRRMDRLVAIKMLPPAMTKDAAAAARFEREVRAAAKLEHPNIVTAYDADQANGVHFMVMQYVEGHDLSALVKKNGPFPVAKAVNYVLQAARGLEFAHKKGVVHRDIKPANLLLDSDGTVKILDMGLARIESEANVAAQAELTGTGTVMGTVDYMSPEQGVSTKNADARADIYSLGCTLHYLVIGKATYGGETVMAKMLAHHHQPIPNLRELNGEVPEQLQTVFNKMVAKTVEDRYQTMSEVIADLERMGGNSGTVSNPMEATAAFDTGALAAFKGIDVSRTTAKTAATKQVVTAKPSVGKQPPWKNVKVLIGAGAAGLALLLGVILIVRDKDDKEVARIDAADGTKVTLPAGGSIQVQQSVPNRPATQITINQPQPVDLLKLIDLKRDVIEGDWKFENGLLVTHDEENDNSRNALAGIKVLQLPFVPAANYQITAVFQRPAKTSSSLRFGLVIDGFPTSARVAYDSSFDNVGLEAVDGLMGNNQANPTYKAVTRKLKTNDLLQTVVISVHGKTVRIELDGRTTLEYSGTSSLSLPAYGSSAAQASQSSDKLFLGSLASYRISKLEYLPLENTKASTSSTIPQHKAAPTAAPPLAKAPFDAAQAKAHQAAWAEHLGTEVETTNSVGQKMILIPPGEFMMGSTDEQVESALKLAEELKAVQATIDRIQKNERPQHKVVITKPFLFSATETTIGQFKKFSATGYVTEAEKAAKDAVPADLGRPPMPIPTYINPGYIASDDLPVAFITWNDAVAYCRWLSGQETTTYRLPTEAEWEYACRAGTVTPYAFGDDLALLDQYGWYQNNSDGKTHTVGTKLPNGFGLFDMQGNLFEWCGDFYDETWYDKSPNKDPIGPAVGKHCVVRSGNWDNIAVLCRSTFRSNVIPSHRNSTYGFRIVRELDAPSTTASVTPPPAVPAAAPAKPITDFNSPEFQMWMKEVQAMSAEEQVKAVSKKMVELNPGFDEVLVGTHGADTPKIENGVVTEFGFHDESVTDISPIRALSGLKKLGVGGSGKCELSDLSPLQGLKLTSLSCRRTSVLDLSPLEGMPLTNVNCSNTNVTDLSPLRNAPLTTLLCDGSSVVDLSPLAGLNLTEFTFTPKNITKGLEIVRKMPSIKSIGSYYNRKFTPEEFWTKYDSGEFDKPMPEPDNSDKK